MVSELKILGEPHNFVYISFDGNDSKIVIDDLVACLASKLMLHSYGGRFNSIKLCIEVWMSSWQESASPFCLESKVGDMVLVQGCNPIRSVMKRTLRKIWAGRVPMYRGKLQPSDIVQYLWRDSIACITSCLKTVAQPCLSLRPIAL